MLPDRQLLMRSPWLSTRYTPHLILHLQRTVLIAKDLDVGDFV